MIAKKTKIICTVSEKHCSVNFIKRLYESGMNIARINSAHATFEGAKMVIDTVRAVSDKIGILLDTKGPEVRLTPMGEDCPDGVTVREGDWLEIHDGIDHLCGKYVLYTNCANFVSMVPVGAHVLIDDGLVDLFITGKEEGKLLCEAQNKGTILGKKSVNVPNVPIDLPPLTEKDKQFLQWAIDNNIDFIAHSFVRGPEDLKAIYDFIDPQNSHLKIISKIENQQGIDNLDEILNYTYGVMIARGDLGVEVPSERIPVVQRYILNKCRSRKRPVIIATQMLHSMIDNPRPTRAEVTDVANAIYESTDAIMLSGETATGKYPVQAVKTMSNIARVIESTMDVQLDLHLEKVSKPVAQILSRSLVAATIELPVKAIIFDTWTGRTGRYLSESRPKVPIYAMCYQPSTMRELSLSFGITSYPFAVQNSKEEMVQECLRILKEDGKVTAGDLVGFIGGSFNDSLGASYMEFKYVQ